MRRRSSRTIFNSCSLLPLIFGSTASIIAASRHPLQQQQLLSRPPLVDVFVANESGYFCIKIPDLLVTANGTLLAMGEARKPAAAGRRRQAPPYMRG